MENHKNILEGNEERNIQVMNEFAEIEAILNRVDAMLPPAEVTQNNANNDDPNGGKGSDEVVPDGLISPVDDIIPNSFDQFQNSSSNPPAFDANDHLTPNPIAQNPNHIEANPIIRSSIGPSGVVVNYVPPNYQNPNLLRANSSVQSPTNDRFRFPDGLTIGPYGLTLRNNNSMSFSSPQNVMNNLDGLTIGPYGLTLRNNESMSFSSPQQNVMNNSASTQNFQVNPSTSLVSQDPSPFFITVQNGVLTLTSTNVQNPNNNNNNNFSPDQFVLGGGGGGGGGSSSYQNVSPSMNQLESASNNISSYYQLQTPSNPPQSMLQGSSASSMLPQHGMNNMLLQPPSTPPQFMSSTSSQQGLMQQQAGMMMQQGMQQPVMQYQSMQQQGMKHQGLQQPTSQQFLRSSTNTQQGGIQQHIPWSSIATSLSQQPVNVEGSSVRSQEGRLKRPMTAEMLEELERNKYKRR